MKEILLVCNEGMSTSFLCNKMNELAKKEGLDIHAWAIPESALEGRYHEADVIMVGPQIGYLLDSIRTRTQGAVPVAAIRPVDFGRVNALAVIEHALSLIQ